jgi:two-component system C4-dicarboxylate transport sensor histidine kinase DctB
MLLVKARYFGIEFRLIFAFNVLAFLAILVSSISYSAFNDLACVIISASFIIVSAESDQERNQGMNEIEHSLFTMSELMVNSPDYNYYFKNLITV